MVVQVAVVAALALASAWGGHNAASVSRRRYRRYRAQTFQQYDKLRKMLTEEYGKIYAAEAAYLPAVLKGYDKALDETAGLGKSQRRQIQRRYEDDASNIQQQMVDSGLSGSTAVQAGLNSASGNRNDQILAVEERVRGIKAQLELGRGQAHGQGITRQVALRQSEAQDRIGLESSYTNFLMALMGGGPQSGAGAIGSALGQAASAYGAIVGSYNLMGAGQGTPGGQHQLYGAGPRQPGAPLPTYYDNPHFFNPNAPRPQPTY